MVLLIRPLFHGMYRLDGTCNLDIGGYLSSVLFCAVLASGPDILLTRVLGRLVILILSRVGPDILLTVDSGRLAIVIKASVGRRDSSSHDRHLIRGTDL